MLGWFLNGMGYEFFDRSHFCQNDIWLNNFRHLNQAYERHCHPFKLMKDTAIPTDILLDGFVLQQDNGSIHLSKKNLDFLRRQELSIYLGPAEARTSAL